MKTHSINHDIADRAGLVLTDSRTSRSASIHFLNSSIRTGRNSHPVHGSRMPSVPLNDVAEFEADFDGLLILFRNVVKDVPAEMRSRFATGEADVHALLSFAIKEIVDRMRGSSLRGDGSSKPRLSIVNMAPSADSPAEPSSPPMENVLRAGPLELDLIDRTAKRGNRQIDLRPREFRLLKYMMERSDKLLTRAALLQDVWNYKFVPQTNLVDVHMGRLRRKVDGPNDSPIIRSIRGSGFVLSTTPLPLD
jgi:DNA-binding winged helix-turn-helix (wHTH) protein